MDPFKAFPLSSEQLMENIKLNLVLESFWVILSRTGLFCLTVHICGHSQTGLSSLTQMSVRHAFQQVLTLTRHTWYFSR